MIIRTEMPVDKSTIRSVVTTAFKDAPRSGGNEADIVDALRDSNALAISLVAEEDGDIVGHVAFSAVSINGQDVGWYGLGPVAVRSDKRRRGFGKTLISSGLERIKEMGARGCVVLGDPAYYGQFGFESDPNLRVGDAPAEHFQRLTFHGQPPSGVVDYHPAFLAD